MLPFKLHTTAYFLGKYVIHVMVKMRFGVSKHSQIFHYYFFYLNGIFPLFYRIYDTRP